MSFNFDLNDAKDTKGKSKPHYIDFDYTLKYINEIIDEKQQNKILDNEFKNKLSIENLKVIRGLVFTLGLLDKKGITTKSYTNKLDAWNTCKNNALDEFGILLSNAVPFSKPTELFNKIDEILNTANLESKDKNIFYDYSGLKKRTPKQTNNSSSLIMKIYNELTSQGINFDDVCSQELYENDVLLSIEQQQILEQELAMQRKVDDTMFIVKLLKYDENYFEILNKYLDQIPK